MHCSYFFHLGGLTVVEKLSTVGNKIMNTQSTLLLHWNYTIISAETVRSVACGYGDATSGALTILVNRTGSGRFAEVPSIPLDYKGRIRIYSSNHTFAIERLMFSDQKSYFCKAKVDFRVSPNNVQHLIFNLDSLNLEVQGRFGIEC